MSVAFEPIQSGTGDPSPTNIRPISGRTEVNIKDEGKNLFDGVFKIGENISNDGAIVTNNKCAYTLHSISSKGTLTVSTARAVSNIYLAEYDANNAFIRRNASDSNVSTYTVNLSNNCAYILVSFNYDGNTIVTQSIADSLKLQIEHGSSPTAYEPYIAPVNITIALGQTVYGGTLNVKTGVLTIDQLGHIFNGAEDITVNNDRFMYYKEGASSTGSNDYNCISSHYPAATNLEVYNNRNTAGYIGICAYSDTLLWNDNINYPTNDVTAYKAYLAAQYAANTPVTAVWKLVTPTTVQLTPAQLMMLKGYNSLSTDGGDVITVTAYVKTT